LRPALPPERAAQDVADEGAPLDGDEDQDSERIQEGTQGRLAEVKGSRDARIIGGGRGELGQGNRDPVRVGSSDRCTLAISIRWVAPPPAADPPYLLASPIFDLVGHQVWSVGRSVESGACGRV
jgi:hypothetical protein